MVEFSVTSYLRVTFREACASKTTDHGRKGCIRRSSHLEQHDVRLRLIEEENRVRQDEKDRIRHHP